MQTAKVVFPNEEAFQETYAECLGTIPKATEAIKSTYAEMGKMLEKYLAATEEWMFRHAYQCGYEAAMEAMQKGGAASCRG